MPKHIAIIMDGNARWARKRMMPKKFGHRQGLIAAENIIVECMRLGVSYITLYAFSLENWFRAQEEVDDLMDLLRNYLQNRAGELIEKGARMVFIGNKNLLPDDIQIMIKEVEEQSLHNKFFLIMAISYGSRDEIRNASMAMAQHLMKKNVHALQEDEVCALFNSFINPMSIPDPDLLIRTSGERRLSNFLLWQIAYTELYFVDKLWPDFDKDDLALAIKDFNSRERRYGK